jgi:hypothetical protein
MTEEFFPVFNQEKFGEDIQKILEKFEFSDELRRKIFSQLMEYAAEQQAGNPDKGSQTQ